MIKIGKKGEFIISSYGPKYGEVKRLLISKGAKWEDYGNFLFGQRGHLGQSGSKIILAYDYNYHSREYGFRRSAEITWTDPETVVLQIRDLLITQRPPTPSLLD